MAQSDGASVSIHPIDEVAASIEARLDAIAEMMLERYQQRIESYVDAPPDVLADIREWAHGSVVVAIGIIKGDLEAKDFIEPLTDVGRRRAMQGFPLRDVLQANMIGAEVLWEMLWVLAPPDPQVRLDVVATAMKGTLELLQHAITAVSNGYLEVEQARVADEEYDLQALVETLAGIRKPDRRHEERAELRGIQLHELKWCVVAQTDAEEVGSRVREMRRRFPEAVIGRVGRTVIGFFPGDTAPAPDLAPAGVAEAENPERGYKRARATLEVALHLGQERVRYEDVVPLAMILGGPAEERASFVRAQLGPLLEDQLGEELIRSLDAYYRAGQSTAAAARELFVHRHTLEYRLGRIETLLKRDIRGANERLLLELALAIRQREN